VSDLRNGRHEQFRLKRISYKIGKVMLAVFQAQRFPISPIEAL